MLRFSKLASLAASARNALSSREAQTTLKNLETINAAVLKLTTTVDGWTGGLLAAAGITNDEAALGQDIKNATNDAKNADVVTEEESKIIIEYIRSTLEPNIKKNMAALKVKKAEFAKANLQSQVQGDLKDLYDLTKNLGDIMVSQAPAPAQADAKSVNDLIEADFQDAIKDFA